MYLRIDGRNTQLPPSSATGGTSILQGRHGRWTTPIRLADLNSTRWTTNRQKLRESINARTRLRLLEKAPLDKEEHAGGTGDVVMVKDVEIRGSLSGNTGWTGSPSRRFSQSEAVYMRFTIDNVTKPYRELSQVRYEIRLDDIRGTRLPGMPDMIVRGKVLTRGTLRVTDFAQTMPFLCLRLPPGPHRLTLEVDPDNRLKEPLTQLANNMKVFELDVEQQYSFRLVSLEIDPNNPDPDLCCFPDPSG